MNLEKIKQTILDLESKEILSPVEKRKLGLAKWRLNNPEKEKERQLKSSVSNKQNKKERTLETKQKMKDAYRKYFENNKEKFLERYKTRQNTLQNKTKEQKDLENKKRSESLKKSDIFQKAIFNPTRLEKIRKALLGHKRTKESIEKQRQKLLGRKLTGDKLLKRQEVIAKLHEKHGNPGFKTKRYIIGNYTVQGKTEKFYLEQLLNNKSEELPFEKKTYYKSPTGYYHPDFEFKNKLVEIKSEFTYLVFEGKAKDSNGNYSTKQKEKCLWVAKNIKPIELIVYNNKNEIILNQML